MTPTEKVGHWLQELQRRIVSACTEIDGGRFTVDPWSKPPGEPLQGQGITMILEGSDVLERAGCGYSHVTGPRLPPSATQHRHACFVASTCSAGSHEPAATGAWGAAGAI